MKKYYILPILGLGLTTLLGFQRFGTMTSDQIHVYTRNVLGASAGNTGAPNESNCTSCHLGGGVNDGSTENLLDFTVGGATITEFIPGQTVDMTLTTLSNVSKKGFQITALDENNNPAGTFIASANTKLLNGAGPIAGRKYVSHTAGTNAASGWEFSWTPPVTPIGAVTFYVATNKSNGNGLDNGDVIYLSQHVLGTSAAVNKIEKTQNQFMVGYSSSNNLLVIDFERENAGEMYINIVDLNGKVVFAQDLGKSISGLNKQKIVLPASIAEGIHIVNFFVDNNAMSGKIMISK